MNLPRKAIATVSFVDQFCTVYENLFLEVRSFECFKLLHLGMISEIKRKTLPAIALVCGAKKLTIITSLSHQLTLGCIAPSIRVRT
jgi:SRSO17 transposase